MKNFMYMGVLPPVCLEPPEAREGAGFLGTGALGGCEPPYGYSTITEPRPSGRTATPALTTEQPLQSTFSQQQRKKQRQSTSKRTQPSKGYQDPKPEFDSWNHIKGENGFHKIALWSPFAFCDTCISTHIQDNKIKKSVPFKEGEGKAEGDYSRVGPSGCEPVSVDCPLSGWPKIS